MNAFEVLGVSQGATRDMIKVAYRTKVKMCHPDQFMDKKKQLQAQEELIAVNLAYEEAMKLTAQNQVGYHGISLQQAKFIAQKLLDQGKYEIALRQLSRAETKDAEFFYIQGNILFKMKEYQSAHQAYREAVRMSPNTLQYRQGALDAAVAFKKHNTVGHKILDWAGGIFNPRKKSVFERKN